MPRFELTTGDADEIKRRLNAGESSSSVRNDYRRFSHSTICAIARGSYDGMIKRGAQTVLTDFQITKLLAFPTPAQAYANRISSRFDSVWLRVSNE